MSFRVKYIFKIRRHSFKKRKNIHVDSERNLKWVPTSITEAASLFVAAKFRNGAESSGPKQ